MEVVIKKIIMKNLQILIFIITIIYAGFYDYKYRLIPDKVHIIIIVNTITYNFEFSKSLAGLIFISLPFIIAIFFDYNSLGGGDIKMAGSIGFFLQLNKGLLALTLGLTLASVFNILILKKKTNIKIPYAPYLALGSILALLL